MTVEATQTRQPETWPIITLAQVRAQLGAADHSAALVVAPAAVRIVDREAESRRRVEQRMGL